MAICCDTKSRASQNLQSDAMHVRRERGGGPEESERDILIRARCDLFDALYTMAANASIVRVLRFHALPAKLCIFSHESGECSVFSVLMCPSSQIKQAACSTHEY